MLFVLQSIVIKWIAALFANWIGPETFSGSYFRPIDIFTTHKCRCPSHITNKKAAEKIVTIVARWF